MGETPAPVRKYDADADLMRVICAFFVCMSHGSSTRTFAAVAYNCFSRFSVPVFVMLSGYYMLAKPVPPKRLARRTLTLLGLLFVWSAIFYGYDLLWGVRVWEGGRVLAEYLLTQPIHLWYLWALLALYLFTPAYGVFCRYASKGQYRYLLGLCFFFGSLAVIAVRSGAVPVAELVLDRMKVPYILGFVFYYLAGGYVRRFGLGSRRERAALYVLGALGMAGTILATRLLWEREGLNELWMSFFAPGLVLASTASFVGGKALFAAHPPKPSPLLRELSDCTLGVYLMHPLVILTLQRSPLEPLLYGGNDRLFVPLRTALVFLLASAAAMLLKRVPLLRRLVHT